MMKKNNLFLTLAFCGLGMLTASGQNTPTASSGQYSPLFLPFTYYGSVAHEALSLDGEPSEMNNALLDMYLRRPDLV